MSDTDRIKRLALARKIERETYERHCKALEFLQHWVRKTVQTGDEITTLLGAARVSSVGFNGLIETDKGLFAIDDVISINGVSLDELADE